MLSIQKSRSLLKSAPLPKSERLAVPTDLFWRSRISERKKNAPTVVDLFAGAGGFSLGFEAAGFHVASAIEIDSWAVQTLESNHTNTKVTKHNIAELTDRELIKICGSPDVVIGGPPCQGFSRANMKAGDPKDPRNSLFMEFLRVVGLCKPKVVVLENVPGLLGRKTSSGQEVLSVIREELSALGYFVDAKVVQSQDFGVPQIRPRLIIIGSRKKLSRAFPIETHSSRLLGSNNKQPSLIFSVGPMAPISTWEAISDLPPLKAREGAETLPYSSPAGNEYQALLRADSRELYNHIAMNHSNRIVERFSLVKWGESGADAPIEYTARKRGDVEKISSKRYDQNNRRMFPDRPCHTIPASFYANFIHPYADRNFTPREGARLQSFPDWYRFMGKPTVVSHKLLGREGRTAELHLCQYNQIGNAVPPLLAYAIANNLIVQL